MSRTESVDDDVSLVERIRRTLPWLPSRWPLVVMAVLSMASGLVEALVVTVIAVAAGALAGDDHSIEIGLGPVDIDTTITQALWVGIGAAVAMVALRLFSGWILADFGSRVLRRTRMKLLSDYLSAPYEVQADSVQAELHELVVDRAMALPVPCDRSMRR